MSIFRIFSKKNAAEHEAAGDDFSARQNWGRAKLSYESALGRLRKSGERDAAAIARVSEKIGRCRESLARAHHRDALDMAEGGAYAEARELVLLALELSTDPRQKSDMEAFLDELERRMDAESRTSIRSVSYETPDETEVFEGSDEEIFEALIATLPEDVQEAYLSYGNDFRIGYLALNDGDFETALDALSRAMAQHPAPDSYIPLELATTYLNLGNGADARRLLEGVVEQRPSALPAYRMLCEIYWDSAEFGRAEALLDAVPEPLAQSVAVFLLKGETLLRAGKTGQAKALYQKVLQDFGWNEPIARALAGVCEAQAELAEARGLYREMVTRCSGCGNRVDPEIQQKYADLCFAAGDFTPHLIETYLALAQAVPPLAAENYDKVSRIYTARGDAGQARRFRSLAAQAALKR